MWACNSYSFGKLGRKILDAQYIISNIILLASTLELLSQIEKKGGSNYSSLMYGDLGVFYQQMGVQTGDIMIHA